MQDPNTQQSPQVPTSLSLGDVLKRSFLITKRYWWTLLQACGTLIVIFFALALLMLTALGITDPLNMTDTQKMLLDVTVLSLMAPLFAGMFALGINAAAEKPISFTQLFRFVPLIFPLAVALLMVSLLVRIGLVLLIIPGIYLFVASVFTLPIIALQRLSIVQALLLSIKTVNRNLPLMIGLFACLAFKMTLVVLSYGLAIVWVMPFYYVALGVVYHHTMVVPKSVDDDEQSDAGSIFNA